MFQVFSPVVTMSNTPGDWGQDFITLLSIGKGKFVTRNLTINFPPQHDSPLSLTKRKAMKFHPWGIGDCHHCRRDLLSERPLRKENCDPRGWPEGAVLPRMIASHSALQRHPSSNSLTIIRMTADPATTRLKRLPLGK